MNKETEELKKRIAIQLFKADCLDGCWDYAVGEQKKKWLARATQILKACKEAGLKFMPEVISFEENEYNAPEAMKALMKQIKEIEI